MAAGLPQVRTGYVGRSPLRHAVSPPGSGGPWTWEGCRRTGWRRCTGRRWPCRPLRMDQYQSCHFAYFLRYGLGGKDRRPAGFHAPEYGTFVHFVLETVLREVRAQGGGAGLPRGGPGLHGPGRWRTMSAGNWGGWAPDPPASAISSAGWNEMSGRWWTMWWRNLGLGFPAGAF